MRRVIVLTFSPTGNARKIGENVGKLLSEILMCPLEMKDITLPDERKTFPETDDSDVLVVSLPVYAGRLPNKIMPELKRLISGEHTPAFAFVTFGNRHYDDALSELCAILEGNGCIPLAAAAIPSEHAFSEKLAPGRPAKEDIDRILDFIHRQISVINDYKQWISIAVPGNKPAGPYYTPLGTDGQPAQFLKAKPKTNLMLCTKCGKCAVGCPMGSIDSTDMSLVPGICIKCQACVRHCPESAKYFDDSAFLSHVEMLENFAVEKKEIEFFGNK